MSLLGAIGGAIVTGLFNKSSAKDQMDYQTNMSNTSHVREVADLKAAGLNPILSARYGGASTPSGAMATMPDLGQVINSATVASKTDAEIDRVRQETATSKANEELAQATAVAQRANTELALANAKQVSFENDKRQYLKDVAGQWIIEGKELDAREADAIYRHFASNRDWNTLHYLDDYAIRLGYRNYDDAKGTQEFRDKLQRYLLYSLDIPQKSALSDFYQTPWGREIAPYLNSAGDAMNILGTGKSLLKNVLPKK